MESVDTEYYNSLLWIKENDPAELDLPFQVQLQTLEAMCVSDSIAMGSDQERKGGGDGIVFRLNTASKLSTLKVANIRWIITGSQPY